ncbi:RagB/SusD family nutrient uptake outer membrane protein [Parabacteroides sp. 52]|uniref:leucine-rich repeat protein n=1 Tax=unclassified Parabacteroides TaxID=2649774 RepID=UPI0013D8BFEC|nr:MULTISPECIES: leucine-rich repeat protein [unclassified Parabacteroides]MDH6533447.1 tetratricopeptide (TPR) repeat protein [Parabacteroides sp. PM5-20]NDV54204.1 RagB/SusD family nutrient uptake outer membrane protein [Parabacteroides sp. 52]
MKTKTFLRVIFLLIVLFPVISVEMNAQKRIKTILSDEEGKDFFDFYYDESGRLTSYKETYTVNKSWEVNRFFYDSSDRLIRMERHDFPANEIDRLYEFTYSGDTIFAKFAYEGEWSKYIDTLIVDPSDWRLLKSICETEILYAYDKAGNMVKMTDQEDTETFVYDDKPSVFSNQHFPRWFWQFDGNENFDHYANPNNVVQVIYTHMEPDVNTYTYDAEGYPTALLDEGAPYYTYVYENASTPEDPDAKYKPLIEEYNKACESFIHIDNTFSTLEARQKIDVADELLKGFWEQSYKTITETANYPNKDPRVLVYKAFVYYNLSVAFGAVPLNPTTSPRTSINELYQQLVADLQEAIDLSQDKDTQSMAQFIIGSIYMQQGKYAEAYPFTKILVNNLSWNHSLYGDNNLVTISYLLNAECALVADNLQEAIASINSIDMGKGMAPSLTAAASSQDIRTAINNKYRSYTQGMNYQNISRLKQNADWAEQYTLLPIPAAAISANAHLTQNPGWGEKTPSEFEIEKGELIKYNGTGGAVVLPEGITKIGDEVFLNNKKITSIVIPEGVTHIGSRAIAWCEKLTRIDLPNSLVNIGSQAFASTEISSITIPENVSQIGAMPFYQCRNLAAVGVASGNSYYKSIEGVLYDSGIKTLLQCPNKKSGNLLIPNTVERIVDQAFDGGNSVLRYIFLPASLTHIGYWSLQNLLSLHTIEVDAANKVYASEEGILYNKEKTTLIFCPQKNTISDLLIPHTVKRIKEEAFSFNNSFLVSITIPSSVEHIETSAILGENLKTVYALGRTPATVEHLGFQLSNLSACTLYVPTGTKSLYEKAAAWKDFGTIKEYDQDILVEQPETEGEEVNSIALSWDVPMGINMVGTFTVEFPEGIVLDEPNTHLDKSLQESFDWVCTALPHNAWQIEIKEKNPLRSALRSSSSRKIMDIAYTTDHTITGKTYTIHLTKIDFTLSNGGKITKDKLSVDIKGNNNPTGIETVETSVTSVSIIDAKLTVNSPAAETIEIYSFNGKRLFAASKSEGEATFTIQQIKEHTLIIKGSSGWVRKVMN